MTVWWLKHTYIDGSVDYIGPFANDMVARFHRSNFGPVKSVLVGGHHSVVLEPHMTVEEHIKYVTRRS